MLKAANVHLAGRVQVGEAFGHTPLKGDVGSVLRGPRGCPCARGRAGGL